MIAAGVSAQGEAVTPRSRESSSTVDQGGLAMPVAVWGLAALALRADCQRPNPLTTGSVAPPCFRSVLGTILALIPLASEHYPTSIAFILTAPCRAGPGCYPHCTDRELQHRGKKGLARSQTEHLWQSWEMNMGLLGPRMAPSRSTSCPLRPWFSGSCGSSLGHRSWLVPRWSYVAYCTDLALPEH